MHTKKTYAEARKKKAVVYWIHYLEHTDPKQDGYIGISTSVNHRFKSHSKAKNHIGNRIRSGAVLTILHEVESLDEAATIEQQYRPTENIGWNLNKGGDMPPSQAGKSHPTNKLKGSDRTEKQKLAALAHSEKMKGRKAWNSGKKTGHVPWNKGLTGTSQETHLKELASIERICPHCNKVGKGSSMLRWHFNNCKFKVGA